MPKRRRSERRKVYSDVEIELTVLIFKKLALTVGLAGLGMVGATFAQAARKGTAGAYANAWIMLIICSLRIVCVAAFYLRRGKPLTLPAAILWQRVYGAIMLAYCGAMAMITLYTYSQHDAWGKSLCMMGSFALSAILSARGGLRPWVGQLCGVLLLGGLGLALLLYEDPILARMCLVVVLIHAGVHCQSIRNQFEFLVADLRSQHKLRDLAERDALTGLANRRTFESRLATLCEERNSFAILFIDLDRFKQVNDTYGHAVGDALLCSVADRLRAMVRDSDMVARLGGDEFAILQHPAVSEAAASTLARRINDVIGNPFLLEQHEVQIGASIGIRMASSLHADPRELVRVADDALYRVKQAGRGGFALG